MTRQSHQPPRPRRDRLVKDQRHDPYRERGHLPEPTVCTGCHASYRNGRWTWKPAAADAHQTLCPACKRVRDDYPGGWVTIEGDFLRGHREEIVNCIRHTEEREARDHPLKRIMRVEEDSDGLVVTTTDPNLARSIGDALHSAWSGERHYEYAKDEDTLRVRWVRDSV